VTIRRDLISLANQNLIQLEHGGATSINFMEGITEPVYDTKLFVDSNAKIAIADKAVELIHDNDVLILDSGTTNFRLAQKIKPRKFKGLTVITSDLLVAKELSPQADISIHVLGGILRSSYFNVYGPFTELILSKLRADKLFLGFDGCTLPRGLSLNVLGEVPTKEKMIEISDEVIAFGNSSKYGVNAPYQICGWDKIHRVIVDKAIEEKYLTFFKEKQIEFNLA
jgi:DeoR/GlpR family transcriptional regulator of sugar metabolism